VPKKATQKEVTGSNPVGTRESRHMQSLDIKNVRSFMSLAGDNEYKDAGVLH
jgi:hypothetical protein